MLATPLIDDSSSTDNHPELDAIPLMAAYPKVWKAAMLLLEDLEKDRLDELAQAGDSESDLSASY